MGFIHVCKNDGERFLGKNLGWLGKGGPWVVNYNSRILRCVTVDRCMGVQSVKIAQLDSRYGWS